MDRLTQIGTLKPIAPGAPKAARLGVGLEKLDRALYDPAGAYQPMDELGVQWVRVQSGWARCERMPGVYDFAWLDDIIGELCVRGLTPWMCLCYGNAIYTESAGRVFGAVGCPPIHTQRERDAWNAYVTALARHFRGRVRHFEIWNEPDGVWCWKHGVNAEEYGAFAARTARAVRMGNPDARVAGGALCGIHLDYARRALSAGMADAVDAVTFHRYDPEEREAARDVRALRALLDSFRPGIALAQGESGAQSSSRGAGAMSGCAFDEDKQARHLLRNRLIDLQLPLVMTSHFSMLDMAEALNGDTSVAASYRDYGYFGLLGARFDENGRATGVYRKKPAFRALQTLAALTAGVRFEEVAVRRLTLPSPRLMGGDFAGDVTLCGFTRGGACGVCYWQPAPLLTARYAGTVSLECACFRRPPVLLNLMTGAVYALDCGMLPADGVCGEYRNLPLTDYPLALLDGEWMADVTAV